MASTYSPTLRIELIGTGDQPGVWGDTTNNNLGALIEQAITGVTTITMTDNNYTLSALNGTVDEARSAVLIATGTNSAQRDIIAPLVDKTYTIKNNTTGGFPVQIIGSSGTGVVIANGQTVSVYCDGTNFYPTSVVGGGSVDGPGSSTNNALARFDGTTGGVIKNSSVTVDDAGNLATPTTVTAGANIVSLQDMLCGQDLIMSAEYGRIQANWGPIPGANKSSRNALQNDEPGGTIVNIIPNGTVATGSQTAAVRLDGNNSFTGGGDPYFRMNIIPTTEATILCANDAVATFVPVVVGVNAGSIRVLPTGPTLINGTSSVGGYNLQVFGTGVWAQGSYVNGSDARIKDNVAPLESCLDVVKAMRPVTYQYKESYSDDQSVQPGFVAQDLQEAMAGKNYLEGVVKDDQRNLNVAYQNLIPILTKAMQEQQEQIEQLKAEVAALKGA